MATEPEPGSWGIRKVEPPPYEVTNQTSRPSGNDDFGYEKAYEATLDSSLGQSVSLMTKQFGMPKRVIYPACGAHVIERLFPGAHIVYIDPSQNGIQAIQNAIGDQARALSLTIDEYKNPEQFDLLFSLNSHADTGQQLCHVKQGGIIFCNNYFGTQDAERIIELGTCNLPGVIEAEDDYHEPTLLISNLEEYLEPITITEKIYIPPKRKKIACYYIFQKK